MIENCVKKLIKKPPSPSVSWDGGRLQVEFQQHWNYDCQFNGSRCRGISVGDGWQSAVGDGLMWAAASCLKVWSCNQDNESAKLLCKTGMCLALKTILYDKQTNTSLRTKNIKDLSRHDCLLITCTKASLSVKNRIDEFLISLPHKYKPSTIG